MKERNDRRNLTFWLFIGEGVVGYGRWLNPIDCQPPKIMLPYFYSFFFLVLLEPYIISCEIYLMGCEREREREREISLV